MQEGGHWRGDKGIEKEQAKRVLITVGGAGAQKEILIELIKKMMPAA